ncbi:MoxR family ATPase [Neobacillus notoginsengisoli]|uniref:MoxR family ATPase n=1 Tax=Neobacillus notoginsengisoli TaxID=1578198 RepID=A0A417YQW3_9BACI|nr:MoxR family ATPase [Neobacillus notoginsengisoli]RHW36435.1 MoxR family ATPase [Neobacillus notoginsengisoli]
MDALKDKENQFRSAANQLEMVRQEIKKFIVGQDEVIEQVLWCIISGGHSLLEGLPGLGKTMMVRTIAECIDQSFNRIQFTPDLMPSDITGTMLLQPGSDGRQEFTFHEGPVFSNIVLADEINRATPKTQSALLEAMAERTVTVMGSTRELDKPFFVLATQNPIDMEGTYPLPEAQMDRFICKILVSYPTATELKEIARRTTGTEFPVLKQVVSAKEVLTLQQLAREILVSEEMLDLAVSIITRTHPENEGAPEVVRNYVQYGSGPRGLQSLLQMAKARALFAGRYHISTGDLKKCAIPVLRHRLLMNFEGEARGISTDEIITDILESTRQGAEAK